LREAHRIFPKAIKARGMSAPPLKDQKQLEELLAVGAYECAALGLISRDAGFMVSRGSNGVCFASVALPGDEDGESAFGETLALAILAAEAAALVGRAEPQREQA
jgi:hypothetical protein